MSKQGALTRTPMTRKTSKWANSSNRRSTQTGDTVVGKWACYQWSQQQLLQEEQQEHEDSVAFYFHRSRGKN
jgi:hypothetical protein